MMAKWLEYIFQKNERNGQYRQVAINKLQIIMFAFQIDLDVFQTKFGRFTDQNLHFIENITTFQQVC